MGMTKFFIGAIVLLGLLGSCVTDSGKERGEATVASPSLPACVERDCDCTDFDSQAQAQRVLDLSPEGDPHHLDMDRDRIACEGWNG
jgi:hypothetical protein